MYFCTITCIICITAAAQTINNQGAGLKAPDAPISDTVNNPSQSSIEKPGQSTSSAPIKNGKFDSQNNQNEPGAGLNNKPPKRPDNLNIPSRQGADKPSPSLASTKAGNNQQGQINTSSQKLVSSQSAGQSANGNDLNKEPQPSSRKSKSINVTGVSKVNSLNKKPTSAAPAFNVENQVVSPTASAVGSSTSPTIDNKVPGGEITSKRGQVAAETPFRGQDSPGSGVPSSITNRRSRSRLFQTSKLFYLSENNIYLYQVLKLYCPLHPNRFRRRWQARRPFWALHN